jgi:hypothetical protein
MASTRAVVCRFSINQAIDLRGSTVPLSRIGLFVYDRTKYRRYQGMIGWEIPVSALRLRDRCHKSPGAQDIA